MSDDDSVLGKGLEALIPSSKGQGDPAAPHNEPAEQREPVHHEEPIHRAPAEPAAPVVPDANHQSRHHGKGSEAVFQLEVEKIKSNPDQPRRNFDESALRELAASIREFGLLQPIVVAKVEREVPTGTEVEYQLIAGERRLMASKLLGLERVPAIIRNLTYNRESLELAVIENIQRENLNPIELARAYARLQDEFRLTQREVAARLGKSREVVANTVRLLDLPSDIQEALEKNHISESHGRLLLTIDDQALQHRLFTDLLENRMTTRELRSKVNSAAPKSEKKAEGDKESLSPELKFLQDRLSSELGAPVSIHQSGSSGRITINFYSEEELQQILNRLAKEQAGF